MRRGDAPTVTGPSPTGSTRPATSRGCARPRRRRSGCARSPAAPASSPSARTASRRRSSASRGTAASRSRRSSCGPGSPPRSCSPSSPASARSPAASTPTSPARSRRSSRRRCRSGAGRPRGRVRIMSPYRARAARARALFCLSLQDGDFPSAAPPDPLLSEERRRQIGNPDLRRDRSGRRGALPVPLLRLAADRAPLS